MPPSMPYTKLACEPPSLPLLTCAPPNANTHCNITHTSVHMYPTKNTHSHTHTHTNSHTHKQNTHYENTQIQKHTNTHLLVLLLGAARRLLRFDRVRLARRVRVGLVRPQALWKSTRYVCIVSVHVLGIAACVLMGSASRAACGWGSWEPRNCKDCLIRTTPI